MAEFRAEHNADADEIGSVLASMAPGDLGWLTDEPDGGPEGWFVKVDDHRQVVVSVLPDSVWEEMDEEAKSDIADAASALASLVLEVFDNRRPRGAQRRVLGRVVREEAEFLARAVAMALIAEGVS